MYRRTIAELEMDWGVGEVGGQSNAMVTTPFGTQRRVWFDERDGEWSPLGWLRDRAV